MKFLCEHCKAKYQISDDKVAGKTVRMKCRKCGNQIEVRAAVTETSVSTHLPQEPGGSHAPPAHAPAGPPRPGGPQKPAPPRPGGGLATSLSAQRPLSKPPSSTKAAESGALAGAFQRTVQRDEEISVSLDLRELSAADEWYVAINGVPVGPVRVAELRRKAALGVVNDDSLVWQEGMEEWRPVRAVTELAAAVREAAGGRASLITPPPADVRSNAPPGASPRPGSARPAPMAPRPPARPAAPARSNVVPIMSRLATAERLDEDATVVAHEAPVSPFVHADPFAATATATPPPAGLSPSQSRSGASSMPLGAPSSALFPSVGYAQQAPPGKSPPWIIIAMLLLAAAFGITAAILVFKPTPVPQVVVTVPSAGATIPAATAPVDVPPPSDTALANNAASPDGGAARSGAIASRGGATGPSGGGRPTAVAPTDPGLTDLIKQAGSGPSTGPAPAAGGGGGGGGQLTSDQVERVVSQHSASVKRTCWERSSSTTGSVNVEVHLVINGAGQVQSPVTSTNNDPVVAHCIENMVRQWQFPGGGTVNIPFKFVHQ